MAAANVGMEVLMKADPAACTPGEVISARMTLASAAVDFVCEHGTPEEIAANKSIIRTVLQQLMMKTSDNLKVF